MLKKKNARDFGQKSPPKKLRIREHVLDFYGCNVYISALSAVWTHSLV